MGLGINNVSVDYFLRGVDAAKPKNAPPAVAPAQVNENQPRQICRAFRNPGLGGLCCRSAACRCDRAGSRK